MSRLLDKVTVFVMRQRAGRTELLLFAHPFAGNQLPAGTVEPGEAPVAAARREAHEETGLRDLTLRATLGHRISAPPEGYAILAEPTPAYARPDPTSWDWVRLRSGLMVRVNRRAAGYTQITFTESDRFPDPQYTTFEITAWVPDHVLATGWRRHFYVFDHAGDTPERWTVDTDGHTFTLFWAEVNDLPELVSPQAGWVAVLREFLRSGGGPE
ncbi:MAG: NUDIX domain-containing protein [Anaerolineae bacterium]|nr:NUDIX domain-containing protein [Anaerolineae bacterium]